MKLQKLIIKNIASIEEAEIDFEKNPLASTEIFLITGKTGAGKTTILDAICLSLFDEVPRLKNSNVGGKDFADEKVAVNDVEQLLRRGTSCGSVILTFEGNNGMNYESTWSITRNKPDKKTKTSSGLSLKNLDTNEVLSQKSSVKNKIKDIIGLDFSQFCRTTMLAQGEFTQFLNSKDNEKAEILEKITGVDIYSKIGVKIFEINKQKETDWHEALNKIKDIHILTEEEIENKKGSIRELNVKCTEIKKSSDIDAQKFTWINDNGVLSQEVESLRKEYLNYQTSLESPEFKEREALVNDWNNSKEPRGCLVELNVAKESESKFKEELKNLKGEYIAALGGQKYEENEVAENETKLSNINDFFAAETVYEAVYENEQTIVSSLSAIEDCRKKIAEYNSLISDAENNLKDNLNPALEESKIVAKNAKIVLDKYRSQITEKEKELSTLNLPEIRRQNESAQDLLNKISLAKERIESLRKAKEQREKNKRALDNKYGEINAKEKLLIEKEAPILLAKSAMESSKADFEKYKDTTDKLISALRVKLNVGDTCPLCNQKIVSELPHEEELAALVQELKNVADKKENVYNGLLQEKNTLEAEIRAEINVYNRDLQAYNEDNTLAETEKNARDSCAACGVCLDTETMPILESLEASTKEQKAGLELNIMEGEAKEAELRTIRENYDAQEKTVNTNAETVSECEKAVNDCKSKIDSNRTLVNARKGDIAASENKVSEFIADTMWQTNWRENPIEFCKVLKHNATQYKSLQSEKQNLETKLTNQKQIINGVDTVLKSVSATMQEWQNEQELKISKVDNLQNVVNNISTRLAEINTNLNNTGVSIMTLTEKLNVFLRDNEHMSVEKLISLGTHSEEEITKIANDIEAERIICERNKSFYEAAQRKFEDHQSKKPELTDEDTIENITKRIAEYQVQTAEFNQQIGAINSELKMNESNNEKLADLKKDADEKLQIYNKWNRLNTLFGDSAGKKFRTIAQAYILSCLIHSANEYLKKMTGRYTLKVTPGSLVIYVEDAYQGYISRPTTTISGGESFIVSLSLALALSEIGKNLKVKTMFIDEGFGTLSGDNLRSVISMLSSLNSLTGRQVGIISHVDDLCESIPVQIQVRREAYNSGSKVVIVPEE